MMLSMATRVIGVIVTFIDDFGCAYVNNIMRVKIEIVVVIHLF